MNNFIKTTSLQVLVFILVGCSSHKPKEVESDIQHNGDWKFIVTIHNRTDDPIAIDKFIFLQSLRLYEPNGQEVPTLPKSLRNEEEVVEILDVLPHNKRVIYIDLNYMYPPHILSNYEIEKCSILIDYVPANILKNNLTNTPIRLVWPKESNP